MAVNDQQRAGVPENGIDELCQRLQDLSGDLRAASDWPGEQLRICGENGVFNWFVDKEFGGFAWPDIEIVNGYIRLASSCLTTAFVISQRTAACKRIAASGNDELKERLLPGLAAGTLFATVGISHLTTSHRHTGRPVLMANKNDSHGWTLNGFSPWVTGGRHADYLVIGAETECGNQILFAIPSSLSGIDCREGLSMVALSASDTGRVEFDNVHVADEFVLTGPQEFVLKKKGDASATGGLQTSALAIGLASAAVQFVCEQSSHRFGLADNANALDDELKRLESSIMALAAGDTDGNKEQLRIASNSFVLRATHSALIAAKGAGFVDGHPVGRWCREALFFLVWSCPQGVSDANMCEFTGTRIES